jgi:hypothetical protein
MSYKIKDLKLGSADIEYFLDKINEHLPKDFTSVVPLGRPQEIKVSRLKKLSARLRGENLRKISKLSLKREDEINELALLHPFFRGIILTLEQGYERSFSPYGGSYERLQIDFKTSLPLSFGVLNPMMRTIFTRSFDDSIGSTPSRVDYDCSSWKPLKLNLENALPTDWMYPNN